MPQPSIHYKPLRSPAAASSCADKYRDVFTLFDKSRILCSDAGGYATAFNAETQSFMGMPQLNSPKGPRYISVSIPSTAAHGSSVFDNKLCSGGETNSLYIMDMVPCMPYNFEVLAYEPVKCWCWCPLPQPPFFDNPEYSVPDFISFAVVGGTRICVSSNTATYSFDTVANQWSKAGDWVLPFRTKAEYDAELGMWFGLSAEGHSKLCAMDLSGVGTGFSGTLPAVQDVGLDVDPPENWFLINAVLVNLGSGRFCIAKFFNIHNEFDDYESHIAVFTGVEVVPLCDDHQGKPVLDMVKHKSEYLVKDSIELVL
ncbi:hypothetical protein PR202_gb24356 [Eleusine coracana subsp. coracana]|uniref:Uncharacterized protein n=1 Tax=Eleusine coracana subsp. coracana TaxID=191504 RepID=A0AAV5FL09_ELECO|nr:hypothetical protein QOZ80_5BG0447450 [Eleusine coracana subsp. coracana]GJN35568.1 hypothetical protein PR202_gb24356 [Eleusine coracana subsp. coracana]